MTLADYRERIVKEIDGVALRVGAMLHAAKTEHPEQFDDWVERELPFGHETARRLMAIYKAYKHLPQEQLAQLPRPWQAMYALKQLQPAELEAGLQSGEIHQNMTVVAAKSYARARRPASQRCGYALPGDRAASTLLGFDPADVSAELRELLQRWLDRANVEGESSFGVAST